MHGTAHVQGAGLHPAQRRVPAGTRQRRRRIMKDIAHASSFEEFQQQLGSGRFGAVVVTPDEIAKAATTKGTQCFIAVEKTTAREGEQSLDWAKIPGNLPGGAVLYAVPEREEEAVRMLEKMLT